MDWDDYRLTPAIMVVALGGFAALMLGFGALVDGLPAAPPLLASALALLVATGCITPERRWSLRIGSWAAALSIPVWVLAGVGLGGTSDPGAAASTAGMIAASWWAAHFLHEQLLPPEWARPSAASAEGEARGGWIEELPA